MLILREIYLLEKKIPRKFKVLRYKNLILNNSHSNILFEIAGIATYHIYFQILSHLYLEYMPSYWISTEIPDQ